MYLMLDARSVSVFRGWGHQSINSIIILKNDWYFISFKNKTKFRELIYSVFRLLIYTSSSVFEEIF